MSFKNCIRIRIASFCHPAYYFRRLRRCQTSVSRPCALGGVGLTNKGPHTNTFVFHLWDKLYGPPIFCNTMSRNNLNSIMKHLWIDNIRARRQHRAKNKFSMFRETLERFVNNSQTCYFPGKYLKIDKQLFPCKSRC